LGFDGVGPVFKQREEPPIGNQHVNNFRRLEDAPDNVTALVRVDFNVPMQDGQISDDTRLRASLPTLKALIAKHCKIALLAHFDRPKGKRVPEMSLKRLAEPLAKLLGDPVAFADDCVGEAAKSAIEALPAGGVILLENTRFHAGEETNDPALAKEMAALGQIYVNDAFSAAHRAHASTEGVAHILTAYAGKQMERELDALDSALANPKRPLLGVVGGAKVSTKLDLLQHLIGKLDRLAIGGGMANTFLFARGVEIGGSFAEKDMAGTAREIIAAAQGKCELLLPLDVVVAKEAKPHAEARMCGLDEIQADDKILDVGERTIRHLREAMKHSHTLIWNGPLGVFEIPPFDQGTVLAAQDAAQLAKSGKLIAVAGGGDTVAALNHAGVAADFTFVSTAGGAFLEWMEGKALPGVEALKR
jgi:phosphoglycerate kinase